MLPTNNNNKSKTETKMPKKCCRVCNDDTLVFFNYCGLSCKSCKKFFLRNAFKEKFLKCRDGNGVNTGKCRLDKEYRRYCKLCRLQKCLAIGMKKELILTNKNKIKPVSNRPTVKMNKNISVNNKPTSSVFENVFELHKYEKEWIATVQKATSVFAISPDCEVVGQPQTLLEAINIGEMFTRKYVKFCKNLPHFREIDTDEQILLLKAAFSEISCINIAFLYDPIQFGFPIVINEEGTKAYFVKAGNKKDHYKRTKINKWNSWSRFINNMHFELESDIVVRDLIFAMLLFKERVTVKRCLEITRYQYNIYCHLLKRYLQKKYANQVKAELKYDSIMTLLEQIDGATKTIFSVFELVEDTSQIVQVMAEIYNLV